APAARAPRGVREGLVGRHPSRIDRFLRPRPRLLRRLTRRPAAAPIRQEPSVMTAADPRKGAVGALRDEIKFLRGLVARPRATGAISPSGPLLTRAMASHVDPNEDLPVIELGPGTGVVTKALLERGVKPARIVAIEYSPEFCRLIRERFP